ncbi:hypothetical protein C6501_05175 [Candidatus Poribacteria bacterium]|nr:MAG: hypothetical protein C6501_05175 [Candidatus Poribacteria bacterium]
MSVFLPNFKHKLFVYIAQKGNQVQSNIGKSDAELVRSYQSGNTEAWNELCIEYGPRLAEFFRSWQSGNTADVQDLVQDTLLAAMEDIHKIEDPQSFNAWILTIATRKRISWFKEQEKRESYLPSEDEFMETTPVYLGPEHIAVNNEYLQIVMDLMKQLSENQRMVILLSAIGMKQKEIAEQLNIKVGNVKVLLMRGKEKLIARLKAKYPDDYADIVDDEGIQSLLGKQK